MKACARFLSETPRQIEAGNLMLQGRLHVLPLNPARIEVLCTARCARDISDLVAWAVDLPIGKRTHRFNLVIAHD